MMQMSKQRNSRNTQNTSNPNTPYKPVVIIKPMQTTTNYQIIDPYSNTNTIQNKINNHNNYRTNESQTSNVCYL